MTAIDSNGGIETLVDKAFSRVAVRVFLWQFLDLQNRMLPDKFLDFWRLVI